MPVPDDEPVAPLERRIAGVAHELRTPLNGMLALADRLLDTPLSDEQRQYIHSMRAAARHLHAVATDVLDVARLQERSPRLEMGPVDLGEILSDLGAPFSARAAAQGIAFRIEMAPGVPNHLLGDPVRLRQMIENITDNALKVTHEGEVVLQVTSAPDSENRVCVTFVVNDTGPGFAGDDPEDLFALFTQGVYAQGGAGLGLALVRGFAEAMGGGAFAGNLPQGGASVGFSVALERDPAYQPAFPAANDAAPLRNDGQLRILVAEDNPINRVVIGTILDQFGHAHDMVGDGASALKAIAQVDYDLILMDKKMPILDGLSTARALCSLPDERARVPIIGLTAGAFAHEIDDFLAAGARAVVTKPISVRALWSAIDDVLGERRLAV
ncbi:ATP-binding protein [Agaricicola taiwanensis]|nr:ATP-binding protein [Agaricicola taiwanensis]